MMGKEKVIGRHVWANLYEVRKEFLNSKTKLERLIKKCVKASGARLHEIVSWKFGGRKGGVSVIALVLESHFAIHTWKEYNYATVDIYTCGESASPEKAMEVIIRELQPKKVKKGKIERSM